MFEIFFHTRAKTAYVHLPQKVARQVNAALDRVRSDPFGAPNVAPLHGELEGLHRIRVGVYRVVIEVHRAERRIFILAIGPRGDIYKK